MEDKPAGSSNLPTATSDTPPTTVPGMESNPAPTPVADPFGVNTAAPSTNPVPASVNHPAPAETTPTQSEPTPIVVTTPLNVSTPEAPVASAPAEASANGVANPIATSTTGAPANSGTATTEVITASAHRGSGHKIWIAVSVIVVVIISGLLGAFLFMRPSNTDQIVETDSSPAPVTDIATPPPSTESLEGPATTVKKEATMDEMVTALDTDMTSLDTVLTKADQVLADKQGDLKE